jgi:hypothetical protein
MASRRPQRPSAVALLLACAAGPVLAGHVVKVVNMIPRAMSSEDRNDNEPSVSADPADSNRQVAAWLGHRAFCWTTEPVFVSSDFGDTWKTRCSIPEDDRADSPRVLDHTVAYSGSHRVYSGIIEAWAHHGATATRTALWRLKNFNNSQPDHATRLARWRWVPNSSNQADNFDQPYAVSAPINGHDWVFLSGNNNQHLTDSSRVAQSRNADPLVGYQAVSNQYPAQAGGAASDFAAVRTAIHAQSGNVYQLSMRLLSAANATYANCYQVRGPQLANGPGFSGRAQLALRESVPGTPLQWDALVGATGRAVANFGFAMLVSRDDRCTSRDLGYERASDSLALAVDPRDHNGHQIVYWAWTEIPVGHNGNADLAAPGALANIAVHVGGSDDSGAHSGANPILTVAHAITPALAVDRQGHLALLTKEWDDANRQWSTRVRVVTVNWAAHQGAAAAVAGSPFLLAKVGFGHTVDVIPVGPGHLVPNHHFKHGPYSGDFTQMSAVPDPANGAQDLFIGAFSTFNAPDRLDNAGNGTGLWHGATARRVSAMNAGNLVLRNRGDTYNVEASVDPFFFAIDPN